MYEKERIERDTYDEDVWSPTNDTTYHKGIGIMYPSDYGYAVGGTVRNTCLSDTLYHYNKNSCYANDWLKASSGSQWLMLRNSNGGLVFYIYSLGFVNYVSGYNCYKVWPTAYLKSSVKITSGSGTTGSPFTLSL